LSLGWVSGVTFARTALSGQWQIGQATNVFNAGASPEPIVLRDINTTVSQTIAGVTAQAGVTYTLNIDLGFGKGNEDLGNAELWIGGKEVIASPAAGDPVQFSATSTITWPTTPRLPPTLAMRLRSSCRH
jgi:hypothetical protein